VYTHTGWQSDRKDSGDFEVCELVNGHVFLRS